MSIIMQLNPPKHNLSTLMDFTCNAIPYAPFPQDFRDAEKPKVDLPNFFSGSSIAVFLRQSSFEYRSLAFKKFSMSLTHPDWLCCTHHACNFPHAVNFWTFHSLDSSFRLSYVIIVPNYYDISRYTRYVLSISCAVFSNFILQWIICTMFCIDYTLNFAIGFLCFFIIFFSVCILVFYLSKSEFISNG